MFRDVIIPPFDIRDYPSPLQSFRKNVRDEADETLFTVQGLPKGARIRTAVMDEYDGMVYNVTDGGPDVVECVLAAALEHVAGRRGRAGHAQVAVGAIRRGLGADRRRADRHPRSRVIVRKNCAEART